MGYSQDINQFIGTNEVLILPDNPNIQYSGRIDDHRPIEPICIYAMTTIKLRFYGTGIKVVIKNKNAYWDNYIGLFIDGIEQSIKIELHDEMICLELATNLENQLHELILFKRQDACHSFVFYGFILSEGSTLEKPCEKPALKIEFYGDSITAGEVSEAIDFIGEEDPPHNGEYSNSWYSYANLTALKLNAEIHNIGQGGIALLDGTGWFNGPNYTGIVSTYNYLNYNDELYEKNRWDFSRFIPDVVVIAIGQNDANPEDYMKADYNCEKAVYWRKRYKAFVLDIRHIYPEALIILGTSILNHHENWDQSIMSVQQAIKDPGILYFTYKNNGCGTKGHVRKPEADKMADELSQFIANHLKLACKEKIK